MLNIVLCCASGMSTSLLVEKMKKAAIEQEIEVNIWAVGENEIASCVDVADVILLGPQARFAQKRIESQAVGIPVVHIGVRDYGMMDGKAVLKFALDSFEKKL